MTEFRLPALPEPQREVLRRIGSWMSENGFYLAGGTALALHLGHRRSVDFDWFTETPIRDPMDLAARMRAGGLDFEIGSTGPDTLHGAIGGVRTSLLTYRYRLLSALLAWPEFGCRVCALEDIACMKLAAVAQRGARKDFLDVHALGSSGLPLGRMLDLYVRKYDIPDIGHVLAGLCYFDDAEAEPMPELLRPVEWETVKDDLRRWVRELAR